MTDLALDDELLARCQTPFLAVDLDAVRWNVRSILRRLDDTRVRWRPHLKTSKLPSVYRELIRAGIRSFKCATTLEAACMLRELDDGGVDGADVLIAFPLPAPALESAAALAMNHPAHVLSVLVESADDAARVPPSLGIWVDVDCGMRRTGVPAEAHAQIEAIARAAGRRWRGVHAYEGHVGAGTLAKRTDVAHRAHRRIRNVLLELDRRGIRTPEVVTSGTPSFEPAVATWGDGAFDGLDVVHAVSPGTVVLHDARTRSVCRELDLRPAATVCSRIVSAPAPDVLTCDSGSKAIAAEAGNPCAVVLDHSELRPMRPSEEHLPMRVRGATGLRRGDVIRLVPRHVCPTVNLADEAVLVEGGRVVGIERVARGHEISSWLRARLGDAAE